MYKIFLTYMLFVLMVSSADSQTIIGKWRTINTSGIEKSIVEIYENDGRFYGKIINILDPEKRDLPCIYCEGEDHNKPILGLDIIKDLEKQGKYYKNGTITDPQDGEIYKCRLALTDNPDKLQVRGYVTVFYETQYWTREK